MLKKIFSVRLTLTYLLILSMIFAGYSIYYKVKYWGFSFTPNQETNIWNIEANISFEPTGGPIKVSMATPKTSGQFKVMSEDILAPGYKITTKNEGNAKIILSSKAKSGLQHLYYRVWLFDNKEDRGKTRDNPPSPTKRPIFDAERQIMVDEIVKMAGAQAGDSVQQIIRVFNENPLDSTTLTFLQSKKSKKDIMEAITQVLNYQGVATKVIRGIFLVEGKKSQKPDLMLEAYVDGVWKIYDIQTGKKGIPENFVMFQRGGTSLLDVEGGENSNVRFSVIRSTTSSIKVSSRRAEIADNKSWFDFSIYSLPVLEQNTLKWLMIFPLAILLVVVMRNVIGLQTMGTFTPMLLAMALVKTGLIHGIASFAVIIALGLVLRYLLSHFNLLLVPRISAVVIFVILIMQMMAIFGHRWNLETALSAAFFPIIIMAWIIERASITWEEDGPINAGHEVLFTLIVAVATYFVIANDTVRHIMFAFNELNLVVLFMVMLLGTYTGYRITELKRFAPIAKKGKK